MLTISSNNDNKVKRRSRYKVLCLGSHSDDIEIGCGGTVLRLLEESTQCEVCWVVFSARSERRREARKSAQLFLKGARASKIVVQQHRDSFFPFGGERSRRISNA